MKTVEQSFPAVSFESGRKPYLTVSMRVKAIKQYFAVVLFFYVLQGGFHIWLDVDQILKSDHLI